MATNNVVIISTANNTSGDSSTLKDTTVDIHLADKPKKDIVGSDGRGEEEAATTSLLLCNNEGGDLNESATLKNCDQTKNVLRANFHLYNNHDDTNIPTTSAVNLENQMSVTSKDFSTLTSSFSRTPSYRSSFFRRKFFPSSFSKQQPSSAASRDLEVSQSFLRTDSIILRVKPGQPFTEYATLVVDSAAKCDPKLGTLGELRHLFQTGTSNQIKKFLRRNNWAPGHKIRAELWKELCRQDSAGADAQRNVYRDVVAKLIKSVPHVPIMLSSPQAVIADYMLKPNGVKTLLQLLIVVEHIRPDFAVIPILYPLSALFLHYVYDEDAFVCVMRMLSHSQKFLLQTDIALAASKRTILVLIKKHKKQVYSFLKKLLATQDDKNLVPIFDGWKTWIFCDLPLTHVVRIVDCFLYEGQKVFFRVTVAIAEIWYKEKRNDLKYMKNMSSREIALNISEFCRTLPLPAPKLLKAAFSIRNMKMSFIRKLQEKHELKMRRGDSTLAEAVSGQNLKSLLAPHHYLDSTLPSNILNETQCIELIKSIPQRYQLNQFSCIFSMSVDGTSFNRLWAKIDDYEPTIIIIKTKRKEIFGGYCSEAWGKRRQSHHLSYFGTGETFVFTFKPDYRKFPWVGVVKTSVEHKEELFQTADGITLIVGGCAIMIRNSLESGATEYSATFDSPALSDSVDFIIESLEVFGLTEEK